MLHDCSFSAKSSFYVLGLRNSCWHSIMCSFIASTFSECSMLFFSSSLAKPVARVHIRSSTSFVLLLFLVDESTYMSTCPGVVSFFLESLKAS